MTGHNPYETIDVNADNTLSLREIIKVTRMCWAASDGDCYIEARAERWLVIVAERDVIHMVTLEGYPDDARRETTVHFTSEAEQGVEFARIRDAWKVWTEEAGNWR